MKPASLKTRAIVLRIAAVAATAIIVGCSRSGPAEDTAVPPVVAVARVARRDLFQELSIQAEFRPYQEVELYSKVAGYLKSITVDFGDRVKAGDLIATIEVPELKDELEHAIAGRQRAEADYRDAHLNFTRLVGVNQSQPNLVAQQDLDAAESRDGAMAASLTAAKADVERFQTLMAYTRIIAPFDGVVTARSADPGALIQAAGSNRNQALPLICLSENQRLRLDFPVSVSFAEGIARGDPVEIRLEGSGRIIRANVTRFTRKISMATRTMDTEVEVANPDLKLIPGMYATVRVKLNRRPGVLALPVEAIGAGAGTSVYLVNPDHVVEERVVKLGLETASAYEVLEGLGEGDLVVVGSRSGIRPGLKVVPKTIATASLP